MSQDVETRTKYWIACWKQAGSAMNALKQAELSKISTMQALQNLSGAFESCRRQFPLRRSSGLVEQQAWFQKMYTLQKTQRHD